MLSTIDVEIIIFIFFIIVSLEIANFNIIIFILNLIALKSEKDLTFILNNLNFKAFILVI